MPLERYWYSVNVVSIALWPLALMYAVVAVARRFAYCCGILTRHRVEVPIVVVGNLSVGGTGKTPLVSRLVVVLREAGYRPGIISRGYGGHSGHWPRWVAPDSDPGEVGDEPVMLARQCSCPVVVAPRRIDAARMLLRNSKVDIIVCDDGLQHYQLLRDVEIVLVDAERRLGNGACLPAGPLREPAYRLRSVDFLVGHGSDWEGEYRMVLEGDCAVRVGDPKTVRPLRCFRDKGVHAVAGIGNPGRFFRFLRQHGLDIIEHPFADHYPFAAADLSYGDGLPVLMTEKDAVKCERFARDEMWFVPVAAALDSKLERALIERLARRSAGAATMS